MKKIILNILALVTLCIVTISPAKAQPFNPQLAAMLQDTLNYYVSSITNIKGMSASVYLPGQGTWQGTAGVSYSGHPITPDMEFGIASNTKLFVAAAMLKLAESNKISLNDSLKKWLPTYKNINPNITIRQLLNHTSGVQDPIFLSPWIDTIMKNPTRIFTPTEVLSWVGNPVFAAGTSWGYSNVNYILAGMVAESATGFHISKIIRDSILTPLNLTNTFYDVKEPVLGTIAHRWYNTIDYNDTSRVGVNTAGGCAGSLFSTSGDMAKWYHALMSGQLLKPASFTELTNFVYTYGPSYTYGLGLESQVWFGHTTYGHGGSIWGYRSKVFYDPCMGAVVFGIANSYPAGMDGVTLLLYRVLVNHVPGCGGIITGATTVCQGQKSVTYTVSPIANATSYVWTLPSGVTGASNTNSITVNYESNAKSGNITVKGNNLYGDGVVSNLNVIVNSLPNATLTASGPTNFCLGGSVELNAIVAASRAYQWQKGANLIAGATLPSYTATTSGSYRVIVSNTLTGCSKTTSSAIVVNAYALPTATITPQGSTTFCAGGSVILSANAGVGLTYKWQKGVNMITGATLQNYTATTAGSYKVVVTNTNNCSRTSAGKIITVNCLMRAENEEPVVMSILPNPTVGMIRLTFNSKENQNAELMIIDITGRAIIQQYINTLSGKNVRYVNLSNYAKGIYLVKLTTQTHVMMTKIVKE